MDKMQRFQLALRCIVLCAGICLSAPSLGLAQTDSGKSVVDMPASVGQRGAEHDFDFEFGTWKTELTRLLHPLSGSYTWVKYESTNVVRKVWNGRANLVELEADGSAGHFEGLSLRLYNPQSHQCSLNFASSRAATFSQPTIGEFKYGRGEFLDQEILNGALSLFDLLYRTSLQIHAGLSRHSLPTVAKLGK